MNYGPRFIPENRKLTDCNTIDCGIEETFLISNHRVVSFHNRPDQFEQHKLLRDNHIETLDLSNPVDANYQDFALVVPKGTVVFRELLKSIDRDVDEYDKLFFLIGEYLHDLQKKCHVLPIVLNDRGILESIAAVPSDTVDLGLSIALTPPYCLDVTSPEQVETAIKNELIQSGFFTEQQIITLMEAYSWGMKSDE